MSHKIPEGLHADDPLFQNKADQLLRDGQNFWVEGFDYHRHNHALLELVRPKGYTFTSSNFPFTDRVFVHAIRA